MPTDELDNDLIAQLRQKMGEAADDRSLRRLLQKADDSPGEYDAYLLAAATEQPVPVEVEPEEPFPVPSDLDEEASELPLPEEAYQEPSDEPIFDAIVSSETELPRIEPIAPPGFDEEPSAPLDLERSSEDLPWEPSYVSSSDDDEAAYPPLLDPEEDSLGIIPESTPSAGSDPLTEDEPLYRPAASTEDEPVYTPPLSEEGADDLRETLRSATERLSSADEEPPVIAMPSREEPPELLEEESSGFFRPEGDSPTDPGFKPNPDLEERLDTPAPFSQQLPEDERIGPGLLPNYNSDDETFTPPNGGRLRKYGVRIAAGTLTLLVGAGIVYGLSQSDGCSDGELPPAPVAIVRDGGEAPVALGDTGSAGEEPVYEEPLPPVVAEPIADAEPALDENLVVAEDERRPLFVYNNNGTDDFADDTVTVNFDLDGEGLSCYQGMLNAAATSPESLQTFVEGSTEDHYASASTLCGKEGKIRTFKGAEYTSLIALVDPLLLELSDDLSTLEAPEDQTWTLVQEYSPLEGMSGADRKKGTTNIIRHGDSATFAVSYVVTEQAVVEETEPAAPVLDEEAQGAYQAPVVEPVVELAAPVLDEEAQGAYQAPAAEEQPV